MFRRPLRVFVGVRLKKLRDLISEFENGGMVEVDTHHVLKGGMEVKFDQAFAFEICDDQFIRIQAFVPYRQPGIGGWIPRVTGFFWRLLSKYLVRDFHPLFFFFLFGLSGSGLKP